ncbi:MAG: bile acid:sodium symporter [Myxococcales bacterium]|nr:bile acid:sodium symporter [Myxococcales bacterium]
MLVTSMSEVQQLVEAYLIPAQLVLAMLGMGATLTVGDFLDVMRERVSVIVGLSLQWLFVPALALAIVYGFELSAGWAVGFLLIAVVPGGTASNLFTFLGRGNTALSVSITLVTTVGSVLSVPLMLRLLADSYVPDDFAFPTGRIVTEIVAYLIAPLALGMWLLRASPVRAEPISKWSIRLSVIFIAMIVVSSLGSGRIEVPAYGWGPPLMLILFGVVLSQVTPLLCRAMRRYEDDATAIGIEVCVRNVGLALLLVRFFFPGQPEQAQVLYATLFYGGMSFFLGIPIAIRHRRYGRLSLLYAPLIRAKSPGPGVSSG